MRTLKLTLKKQWFDMILSGEKKEEYREVKPYWISRLVKYESRNFYLMPKGIIFPHYKKYDLVEFTNGYGDNRPQVTLECKGITINQGRSSWGAPHEDVFIIKLGKEISRKNIEVQPNKTT